MAAFVLYSDENEAEVRFSQHHVIIGQGTEAAQQLGLPEKKLDTEHLVFTDKEGALFIQNRANDPFVTLNNKPFGRKRVKDGDRLCIGQYAFTIKLRPNSPHSQEDETQGLDKKSTHSSTDLTAATQEDPEVEALIRELEAFENPVNASLSKKEPVLAGSPGIAAAARSPHLFTVIDARQGPGAIGARIGREALQSVEKQTSKPVKPRSLRDRESRILDSEKEPRLKNHFAKPEAPTRPTIWRPIIAMTIVLFAICTALLSGLYFTFSEQSDGEEYLAAQALADTSMAMLYAQIHYSKPPNQNWGDPGFIQDKLSQVLSKSYSPIVSVDAHGAFEDFPYMLRVYTSGDMSQFLLVAQPEPNLWQWLLSRETILLDSRTMALHKTTEVQDLNKLVANEKPLDGASALEISQWVSTTDLIRLGKLASEMGRREFNPPQDLQKIHPGAERRVYNAPRYHPLTSKLTERIAQLSDEELMDETVIQPLKQQVERLRTLPDLVFFSTGSEESAYRVREAIEAWTGDPNILVAVITFDTDGARIVASHLLPDELSSEPTSDPGLFLGELQEAEIALAEEKGAEPRLNPILLTLRKAVEGRREELRPLSHKIRSLLRRQQKAPLPHFNSKMDQLLDQWEIVELGQEVDIRQEVVNAYRIYVLEEQSATHQQFVHYARQAQADAFLPPEFLVSEADPITQVIDLGEDEE